MPENSFPPQAQRGNAGRDMALLWIHPAGRRELSRVDAKRLGGKGVRNTRPECESEHFRGIIIRGFWKLTGKTGMPEKPRPGYWQ